MIDFCFFSKLPDKKKLYSLSDSLKDREFVIVYDSILNQKNFSDWLKQFKYSYSVNAGEELKTIESFHEFVLKISKITDEDKISFVSVGGGSVGDFVGFVASVYQRGVPLVHIPSTWIAAIDSSHGGKTALNLCNKKNQIGSFYPSAAVVICKELLTQLDENKIKESSSELLKIALICGGSLLENLQKGLKEKKPMDFSFFYSAIPLAIECKMSIVKQDFKEEKGIRTLLNLGHTLGHILELKMSLNHGLAVAKGLLFCLNWSLEKKFISQTNYQEIYDLFSFYLDERIFNKNQLSKEEIVKALYSDKKKTKKDHFNFIFIKSLGNVFLQEVSVSSFLDETKRQGWSN